MTQIILPVRIQRSRQHKTISPNGLPVKSVCRPGKYGNPFYVTEDVNKTFFVWYKPANDIFIAEVREEWAPSHFDKKEDAITACLACFETYLDFVLMDEPDFLEPLKGCNLSCFCKLEDKCHSTILLQRVNADLILAEYNQVIPF